MSGSDATKDDSPKQSGRGKKWVKGILIGVVSFVVLVIVLVVGALLYFQIPSNTAGVAAQSVCAGTFVAGRDSQEVFDDDVKPQNPALGLVSLSVDESGRSVSAKFLGMFERRASLLPNRGCVLNEEPDPAATPFTPTPPNPAAWPEGNSAVPAADWPAGVDAAALTDVVEKAFVGAGDATAANARGVAVVYDGQLLVQEEAPGFDDTPLLGFSMTKTVNAMLFYKRAMETGFDINQLVVDAFPADREPTWVAQWRQDGRKDITVADLLFMRSGLDGEDDYGPTAKVVQMLYGEPSMAGYAASMPLIHEPGTVWAYSTGTSDILSQIAQGMFTTDEEYWAYPKQALFDPIGVQQGTMFTDTYGTWVGGSYLWALTRDWARLGQVMLADGKWGDQQVLPAGWWELAGTPAMPDGDGRGYGAQTWIPGSPVGGVCNTYPGVPQDTLWMGGHYGQVVAMIPSQKAVVVRLGWTIDSEQFDDCQFMSDTLATLPK